MYINDEYGYQYLFFNLKKQVLGDEQIALPKAPAIYSLVIPWWRLEPNVEMISPPEKHLYQVIQVIHILKYFRIGDDFLGQIWDPSPQIMV